MSINARIAEASGQSGKAAKTKKRVLGNLSLFLRKSPPTTPLHHQPWLYYIANGALLASLGLLICLGYLYPTLQNTLLPTNDIRFSNNGQYFLVMAWLFIMPFLISTITYCKFWVIPSWRNSFFTSLLGEQLRYIGEQMIPEEIYKTYDPEKYGISMIKKYALITLVILVVTLPLQYQALQSSISLNESGITITKTFSLTKQTYSWNDVTQAKRTFKVDDSISPQLLLIFSDGQSINLWDTGFNGTKTESLISAIDLLRSHNIFITTENTPSLTSLRQGRQDQITTVFAH